MHPLLQSLMRGEEPGLEDFLQTFGTALPWLLELESTPQDPIWHAEGNVFVHTGRVLQEVYKLDDLAAEPRMLLALSAVLHDIAKPRTTKTQEIDGSERIVAPRHPGKGRSYLAYKMFELGLSFSQIHTVMALVGHHHDPRRYVKERAPLGRYWHLASLVDLGLLYRLAVADILGRDCDDKAEQLEVLEYFKLQTEEYGAWQTDPYAGWTEQIKELLVGESPEYLDHVIGNMRRDHAQGIIFTPEEALSRSYPYRAGFAELVVMCGPSGSGKSTWIAKNLPEHARVSLDDLRQQLTGHPHDQSANGQARQMAYEATKAVLRKKGKVVWDATNLIRDIRAGVLELGFDYHALVTLVVFQMPEKCFQANNQARAFPVLERALGHQLESVEFPYHHESHRTLYVGEKGLEWARVGWNQL